MKKLVFLVIFISVIFLFPSVVHAVDICPAGQFSPLCTMKADDSSNILSNVFTLLLTGAVLLSIGFLIWGGIKWIISGGDKGKLDAARGTITAAIIGLVISFFAFFIIGVVNYLFGLQSSGKTLLTLPRLVSSS